MNKGANPVQYRHSHVVVWHGNFTGANGANGTSPGGEVVSATRSNEGLYDLVLRTAFPATDKEGKSNILMADVWVLGTAGDRGFVSAYDPDAKTMSVRLYTLSDVLDDCDAKVIRIRVEVRNSTSRKGK